MNSFLSWLTDRLILCPTTHTIDAEGKACVKIPLSGGHLEAWVGQHGDLSLADPTPRQLVVIKFPGTAGRAERASLHPVELWDDFSSEVWTINHRGYGGSTGPASIQLFAASCDAAYQFITEQNPNRMVVVTGNSLGCLSALYLAARYKVAGVLLRNPPPIHELIHSRPRYKWWSLGLSRWVAAMVPKELNTLDNAANCSAPCLFVQSEKDRLVPQKYQDLIIQNYQGPYQTFTIPGADHHDSIDEEQHDEYIKAIQQLGTALIHET